MRTVRTVWNQRAPVAAVHGPVPGECVCIVTHINNNDPNPQYGGANYADAISYKIDVDTPNGPLFDVDNVVPLDRWPRPWIVDPLKIATGDPNTGITGPVYPCTVVNGRVYLLAKEDRHSEECG